MPIPALSEVGSSRGAPTGRPSYIENVDAEKFNGRMFLQQLPMVSTGDYDTGGAYWGCGSHKIGWMYRAYFYDSETGENIELFFRAKSRGQAKEILREQLPNALFYR